LPRLESLLNFDPALNVWFSLTICHVGASSSHTTRFVFNHCFSFSHGGF
jgi:hypothetical protein